MLLLRQSWVLTTKTILIVLFRHAFTTPLRAFVLPVAFMIFISYAKNLFIPNSTYGIGSTTEVRSLADALSVSDRRTVALVNNGFVGGDIQQVIGQIAAQTTAAGKTVQVLDSEDDLLTTCRSNLNGVSHCYGAAVFYSSPTQGPDRIWNYTLRADGALGTTIDVGKSSNDAEIYLLPFQHFIDATIASVNSSADVAIPTDIYEYPFTSMTEKEHQTQIRIRYMGSIIDILGVAFFIAFVGVVYQLVGFIASERELGMSQLIEAMMPNERRWQPQVARFISYHLAFDIIYSPSWIIMAVVLGYGVFAKTSFAVVIFFHILAGLALSSWGLFGAAFFKRAQLSGIITTIASLLFAVLAQIVIVPGKNAAAVAVLSLLFPPMNYTFFVVLMARWERLDLATDLVQNVPDDRWALRGIIFWIFFIVQILVYPILGALIERQLYGTASAGRTVAHSDSNTTVEVTNFTKQYPPTWFNRKIGSVFGRLKETVTAVNDLSMTALKGQITILLGANGSGKSTTLDTIAGLNTITSGQIQVAGSLGLCPQKNVLWDELTVEEHVRIFNRLKTTGNFDSKPKIHDLIEACDLRHKINSRSKTLSGGQKRKLQLAIMFTGDSSICCVDECSSGLDPISRKKIWDILLAERGARTIILTTHFLDEADLLSDQILILSKGSLRAQGSAVELKHRLGDGYRIHVYHDKDGTPALKVEGFPRKELFDQTVYTVPSSREVSILISQLENLGISEYQVNGPTIEDVFLKLAEEIRPPSGDIIDGPIPEVQSELIQGEKIVETKNKDLGIDGAYDSAGLNLLTGSRIGMVQQAFVLFRKRMTVLRRNYLPHAAALLIPVVGAGLVTRFLIGYSGAGCSPTDGIIDSTVESLASQTQMALVVGPASQLPISRFNTSLSKFFPGGGDGVVGTMNMSYLINSIQYVETLDQFNNFIQSQYYNITPGGFFLGTDGTPTTFAYKGNGDISYSVITQNLLNSMLANLTIGTQYASFDIPWQPGAGNTLQLITYFGLCMAAYPAFFSLYPTVERLRNVRQLHYSNGVRSMPLWLAHLCFDFILVLIASVITIIIFRAASNVWYHIEYLFVVFFLYGLASILLSYIVSLFAGSQLASFAFAAGGQAVMFLLYFIAYFCCITYASPDKVTSYVNIVHFVMATITPIGNVQRALFVALNIFSLDCRGTTIAGYPGEITLYGGPILYLIIQIMVLFSVLLWWDNGLGLFRKSYRPQDLEESEVVDKDVSDELKRVSISNDGLRVLHLSKVFGHNIAVENVSFGVKQSEVFALLGPNGAGKSTTISLIRGDILPSQGDIFVEDVSVRKHRAAARAHLGVCPQFDAIDQMTVLEHLRFYARIRGVRNVEHNVQAVVRAVGLTAFTTRMAAALSGGNRRKLSLAIALMGNPRVLLLDEPSSGMDAAAKRIMWRTLAAVVPGRALVLTTHSMEEADALAHRAGIMARRMLALGDGDALRRRFANKYHVHLVLRSAPHTSPEEMARVRSWVLDNLPGAQVEDKTFHGQLRFSVPARATLESTALALEETPQQAADSDAISAAASSPPDSSGAVHKGKGPISALFALLEDRREELGLEYYSVSQTTLDQVFLEIVGRHHVEEEGAAGVELREGRSGGVRGMLRFRKRGRDRGRGDVDG